MFVFKEQERPGGGPQRTPAFTDVDIGADASDIFRDDNGIRFTLTPNAAILPESYAQPWAAELGGAG